MAFTFSSRGVRWTVHPLSGEKGEAVRGIPDGTVGLYFQSADGDARLLHLRSDELVALGDLSARSNADLAALAAQAVEVRASNPDQDPL